MRVLVAGALLSCAISVMAQQGAAPAVAAASPEAPSTERSTLRYTYGFKFESPDLATPRRDVKVLPVVGLIYGRWRLGTNSDPDSDLGFASFRREPTVGYEAVNNDRFRMLLGLRIQNMTTGEAINLFESGRHTLRGRIQTFYQVNPTWSLGTELTQDLMNRGDGTTLTLGASRKWRLTGRQTLSLGAGVTWASAEHWQTPYFTQPAFATQARQLTAGFGGLGAGLNYRKELRRNLVWSSTVSIGQSIGQLQDLDGSRIGASLQTGLLWSGQR